MEYLVTSAKLGYIFVVMLESVWLSVQSIRPDLIPIFLWGRARPKEQVINFGANPYHKQDTIMYNSPY